MLDKEELELKSKKEKLENDLATLRRELREAEKKQDKDKVAGLKWRTADLEKKLDTARKSYEEYVKNKKNKNNSSKKNKKATKGTATEESKAPSNPVPRVIITDLKGATKAATFNSKTGTSSTGAKTSVVEKKKKK